MATQTHSQTKLSDPYRRAKFAIAAMFFANGVAYASWVSRIPAIQQSLSIEPAALGGAMLTLGVGALLSMKLSGRLSERLGTRNVTYGALLFSCIGLIAVGMSQNIWQLAFTLFLFGIFMSTMDVAMNAHGVTVQKLHERPVLSTMHALWSFGGMAGAALGSLMAKWNIAPQTHFIYAAALLFVIGTLSLSGLLPSTADNKDSSAKYAGTEKVDSSSSLLLLALICFLGFVAEGAIADWSALYIERSLDTTASFAALGFSCFCLVMAIARLLGDRVTAAIGPKAVLQASGFISAVSLALIVFIKQPWFAIVGLGFTGIGLAIVVPVAFGAAGMQATSGTASAIAKVAIAGYFGLLVGPPLLGFVAQFFGFPVAMLAIACFCLLICITGSLLKRS